VSTYQFRICPQYTEQLAEGQHNNSKWYRYLQQNELGTPPSGEIAIAITGSPFSYQAPQKGFVILSGGTVSAVAFSRTTGIFYATGQTSGVFPMSQNDILKITFSGKPAIIFIPT
jgi:hypothetical protein